MTVCRMCEGTGVMTVQMNSDAGIATKRCKNCNGTGVIVTAFSGESEQFPDKEIFRMGTEKFEEVFEDEMIRRRINFELIYLSKTDMDGLIRAYIGFNRVKISCKPGKIIIQRLEK